MTKFQKNSTKEFFSKLKQLFLKIWNKRSGKNDFYPIGKVLILSTLFMFTWVLFSDGSDDSDVSLQKKSKQTLDRAYKCLNKDPNKGLYKAVESALWSYQQGIQTKNDNYFSQSIHLSNAVIDNYTIIQSIKC